MRYMMLIYSHEGGREGEYPVAEELTSVAAAHKALMEETAACGILRDAQPLQPSSTATLVRVKGDKVTITDGPFAETKEQIAGYYILDCENLDEAIAWAARIPTECQGAQGCVEIRPIREFLRA